MSRFLKMLKLGSSTILLNVPLWKAIKFGSLGFEKHMSGCCPNIFDSQVVPALGTPIRKTWGILF